ncbi:MAG: hypothetical protein ABIQ27_03025 [Flavobacterium sp.]|uniref:hypothetical protein n=1 Tax=Flavobacterium sp. TaxID=239 RepID=UPI0032647428
MKREYFGMLFFLIFIILIFITEYFIGEKVYDYLSKFIIVWLMLAYQVGQYSMRFPKAF